MTIYLTFEQWQKINLLLSLTLQNFLFMIHLLYILLTLGNPLAQAFNVKIPLLELTLGI